MKQSTKLMILGVLMTSLAGFRALVIGYEDPIGNVIMLLLYFDGIAILIIGFVLWIKKKRFILTDSYK